MTALLLSLMTLGCARPDCRPEDQTLPGNWPVSDELWWSSAWWDGGASFVAMAADVPVCATGIEVLDEAPEPDAAGHSFAWDGPGTPLQIGPSGADSLGYALCHARLAALPSNPLQDHTAYLSWQDLPACPGCGLDEALFLDETWVSGCLDVLTEGPQLAAVEFDACPGSPSPLASFYADAFPWRAGIDAPLPDPRPISWQERTLSLSAPTAPIYTDGMRAVQGDLLVEGKRGGRWGLLRIDPDEGEVGWFPLAWAHGRGARLFGGDRGPVVIDGATSVGWQLRPSGFVQVAAPPLAADEVLLEGWLDDDGWTLFVSDIADGSVVVLRHWSVESGVEDLGIWPAGTVEGVAASPRIWRAGGHRMLLAPLVLDDIDTRFELIDLETHAVLQRFSSTSMGGLLRPSPTPSGSLLASATGSGAIVELRPDGLSQLRQTACDADPVALSRNMVAVDGLGTVGIEAAGDMAVRMWVIDE